MNFHIRMVVVCYFLKSMRICNLGSLNIEIIMDLSRQDQLQIKTQNAHFRKTKFLFVFIYFVYLPIRPYKFQTRLTAHGPNL
jgi:hypothetical protein